MPSTRFLTPLVAATLVSLALKGSAQQPDSTRCRQLLSGPTRDSVVVRIGMNVSSVDSFAVSTTYRSIFVQAVRQELKLPRPLPIEVYGIVTPKDDRGGVIGDGTVAPVIAGDYRATIKRDGHITGARVVGGARTKEFDDAVLAAIRAVGDSQSAPPFAEEIKADSAELRLSIRDIGDVVPAGRSEHFFDPRYAPLFAMRVPSFGFPSSMVKPDAGNPNPRYPVVARQAHLDGEVIAEFIVTSDGRADVGSLQIVKVPAIQFIEAVLDVLPQYRFKPLAIAGCPLASVVRMPFTFQIR